MADQIRIRMFGGFSLFVNQQSCDRAIGKSKKGTALLQFLILRQGEVVRHSRLIESLWPKADNTNPENALKTLISRLRTVLNECSEGLGGCIVSGHGGYRFAPVPGMTVDLYEFEELEAQLQGRGDLNPETDAMFRKLITLYAGDLLAGTHLEDWAVSRSVSLHGRYVRAVYTYLGLLKKAGRHEEIIQTCRTVMENDPYDERLHLELLQALAETGRGEEAMMQYRHVTNMHFRRQGDHPPEGFEAFFRQIVQTGDTLDINLDTIREELMEFDEHHGAYECDYSVFREIYNLQVRNLERLGSSIFLAVIMISGVDGRALPTQRMNKIMKGLGEVLRGNLRKGDTITRFRPSQYALLLPTVNMDNGHLVMERVKRVFYQQHTDADVLFNYRIGPLCSAENEPRHRSAGEYAALRGRDQKNS